MSEWKPVTEQPRKTGWYPVVFQNTTGWHQALFDKGTKTWSHQRVVHWLPVPPLPDTSNVK